MGALRLASHDGGSFLADEALPVPPLARLREIEHWAREAEQGLSEEMSSDERCTGNRDDHLRNHGFLRAPAGWRLAPAFDLNPSPEKVDQSLAFDDRERMPNLDSVRETAGLYRLSPAEADALIGEVAGAVDGWRRLAAELDLPGEEIGRLAGAFLSP